MGIQQKYFEGLVESTPWNRAPDDPAAAPKAPLSPGLAAHLEERKTTDFEPYLKQEVSQDRFVELLNKASFTSAAGPSGLSYTLIALSTPAFQEVIRALINYALKHGVVPRGWQRGWLYPLQKDAAKGAELKNLRPITLLETPLKLLTMHLNSSIHDAWDAQPTLSPVQTSFLRSIGTNNALALVTSLYEQRASQKVPTHVAYLDLELAFCAVPHWAIKKTLERLNIPQWAVDLMQFIDIEAFTSVITAHGLSQTFKEETGVRQGCILSPLKFIAWMDVLLCWLHDDPSDIKLGGLDLHALAYADDIWLVAAKRQALQGKLNKASEFLNYFGVHCNAGKSYYSTTEHGFDPGTARHHELYVFNLRTNTKVKLTAVLPTEAIKYLGIRLTLYNDSAAQVRACSAQFYEWIAALRRSRYPGPMIREMARAKIGGFLGYSFPYLDFPDTVLQKWQSSLDALLRDKERLTGFASTSQCSAPVAEEGLGGLDLFALRDSNTVAMVYGALNASARLTGAPSALAQTLRAHLAEWRQREGLTVCPLANPSVHTYTPSEANTQAGRGTFPRVHRALAASGTLLHDKAAANRLGRCRDIPLSALPAILDGVDPRLGHGPLGAEFNYLRQGFAKYDIQFLGDISTDDGTRLLLPRQFWNKPDNLLPKCFRWLRQHATTGPSHAWTPAISVGPALPSELPNHLPRLALSEARQFFHPVWQ